MKNPHIRKHALILLLLFLATLSLHASAEARIGGSRSMGSRGSRSYSRPMSPPPSQPQGPTRQTSPTQPPPASPTQPPPSGGGFWRGMAGGIAGGLLGGMLGGMLFRGLGLEGGSGMGLLAIILFAVIGFLIFRMLTRPRQANPPYQAPYEEPRSWQSPAYQAPPGAAAYEAPTNDLATGIGHIRQMDPDFTETQFGELAMDLFFRVQGAWMHRDLTPVLGLLTEEMQRLLQADVEELKQKGRINRLENIAVRSVEIVEAWQEEGQDFVTCRVLANLLDYTTDEAGKVLEGSTSEPVKFEEYWSFTRPIGPRPWRLSAIDQK